MKLPEKKCAKVVFFAVTGLVVAVLLVFIYLFLLNGRYEHVKGEYFFDNWTREIIRGY